MEATSPQQTITDAIRILILEDDPVANEAVREILSCDKRFRVIAKTSREDFQSGGNADDVDVILSNVGVFNLTVQQILDQTAIAFPERPIIFLSQRDSAKIAVDALKRGAADFVVRSAENDLALPQLIFDTYQANCSKQQQDEKMLRERFRLLETVFEETTDVVFVKDIQGRFLMANTACANVFGKPVADMIGKTDADLVAPQAVAAVAAVKTLDQRIMSTGKAESFEESAPNSEGELITFLKTKTCCRNTDGHVIGLVGIGRDITARKHAENALQESEERFLQLAESSDDVFWVNSIAPERVLYVSPAFERLWERSAADLYQNPRLWIETIHPDDRKCVVDAFEAIAQDPLVDYDQIYRIVRADGTTRWIHDRGAAVYDATRNTYHLNGVARDITRQREAEEALRGANATLEARVEERTVELQKSNAHLNAFTYSVAHDLRAPLRAMHGFAQAIIDDYGDSLGAQGRSFANRIINAADSVDELIQGLLEYSRIGSDERPIEPTDLNRVLEEVLSKKSLGLRRNAEILVADNLPAVLGNRPVLKQIVVNLLRNAVMFVGEGVRPQVQISTETHRGRVRLWVEDNGIGILPEYHEQIFQVFERLHSAEEYPGTGIGLAIVRRAAESLAGTTGVNSIQGAGSRFWVELPQAGN